MTILRLAFYSLRNRAVASALTMLAIALGVALLLGVEMVRSGARESFSNTISQTDLIVGARGGSLQLVLYTVFRIGSAPNNISYASYQHFRDHPAVAWTIPYSLGDSHRGFRVVGTSLDFYQRYRYRRDRGLEFAEGRAPGDVFDVALGSEVASALGYRMGDRVVVSHGLAAVSVIAHDDKPFRIIGILRSTGTPIDRSLYITLEGMEAIHLDWTDGAPPAPGESVPAERVRRDQLRPNQVTAFLLGARSRIDTLRLQREINTYAGEPLLAIIPGVAMAELWRTLGYGEQALLVTAAFVALVSLLGMMVSLYTSMNERRREIAVLRAIGMGPRGIVGLLVAEAGLIGAAGAAAGAAMVYALTAALRPWVENEFNVTLILGPPTPLACLYLALLVFGAFASGLLPAWKAYRNALHDGLSIRL